MPDLRATLEDQIAEGDRVTSRWTGRGTHIGILPLPSGPVQPTGAAIEFAEIRIDRYKGEDRRVVVHHGSLHALAATGSDLDTLTAPLGPSTRRTMIVGMTSRYWRPAQSLSVLGRDRRHAA